ncbi:hypothetical protein PMAYCL1PPCAC_00691, partial [Pristionchus mayeri]
VSGIDDVPLVAVPFIVNVLISQRIGDGSSEIVGTSVTSFPGHVSENSNGLADFDSVNFEHGKSADGRTITHGGRHPILHLKSLSPASLVFEWNASKGEQHADGLSTSPQIEVCKSVVRH